MNHGFAATHQFGNRRQLLSSDSTMPSPLIGESTRDMLNFSIFQGLPDNERVDCRFASVAPEAFSQKPHANNKKPHGRKLSSDTKSLAKPIQPLHEDIVVPPLLARRRSEDCDTITQPEIPQRWNRVSIEVMPYYKLPLAGSKETLHAYRTDRCQHTVCTVCEQFLYVIESASMVLCPECKAIGPVERNNDIGEEGLLGLGMTVEHLLADPDRPDDSC